jgi:hypothetical protein
MICFRCLHQSNEQIVTPVSSYQVDMSDLSALGAVLDKALAAKAANRVAGPEGGDGKVNNLALSAGCLAARLLATWLLATGC